MMSFDEFQEKCVLNKDKVEKYSKILTVVLIIVSSLISYFTQPGKIVSGIFLVIVLISTATSKTTNDRIFSNFPAILGLIAVSIFMCFFKDVAYVESVDNLCFLIVCVGSLVIWLTIYCLHCFSVNFLDLVFFENPKLNYSTRIIRLEHEQQNTKNGTRHYYYVYFDGFKNSKFKEEITDIQYRRWKEGDIIQTILVPRIDGEIVCKSIWRPNNFEGLTDMEIDKQQHIKDVELFGMSQEEMDEKAGTLKTLSYKIVFFVLAGADLLFGILSPSKYSIIKLDLNIFCLIAVILITILTSYKEYKHINEKYTQEDIKLWKDYLLPRCLLYIGSSYIFLYFFYIFIFNN